MLFLFQVLGCRERGATGETVLRAVVCRELMEMKKLKKSYEVCSHVGF